MCIPEIFVNDRHIFLSLPKTSICITSHAKASAFDRALVIIAILASSSIGYQRAVWESGNSEITFAQVGHVVDQNISNLVFWIFMTFEV